MGFFFSKPAAPAKVPTDIVLPFHYFDHQELYRAVRLQISFCFNDVLDAEKLRSAFARLLEMDGWRKLGARLRLNSKGKLEYHLPATFTQDRPSFVYSFEHFGSSIADHPVGSRLPRAGDQPATFGDICDYNSLLEDPRLPRDYKEWVNSDMPQLGLRIVTFADATCITVTFLHTLTDLMGLAIILRAWVAVLDGKEEDVPPFVGFDTDPMLLALEGKPPPRFILVDKIMRGLSLFVFGIRTMFQSYWYPPEGRYVFLPAEKVRRLREDALRELATQNPDKVPSVSENDILSAWWTRALVRVVRPAVDRTITIMNAFDCRGVLTEMGLIPSPDVGLITNAVNGIWTVLSARQVLEEPLGSLALQTRRSLEQQRTVEQVRAGLAEAKDSQDRTGFFYVVGNAGMMMVTFSNWQKAKFFTLDFSPAVTKVGTPLDKRDNQLGRPSYISVLGMTAGSIPLTHGCVVVGKDEKGNYWFGMQLPRTLWAGVEQQMREM
ncbi:hypothetical protein VTN49DRAFT_2937 [Thermomyces lanuginosus]|uniref:uncharacterized protein n=1 Tax=Thermomyces lanuginosus TaxID=5541 RepID=UPI0037430062